MKTFVLNTEMFMQMPLPSYNYSSLEEEQQLTELFFMNDLATDGPAIRSEYLPYAKPPVTDFGLDKVLSTLLLRVHVFGLSVGYLSVCLLAWLASCLLACVCCLPVHPSVSVLLCIHLSVCVCVRY